MNERQREAVLERLLSELCDDPRYFSPGYNWARARAKRSSRSRSGLPRRSSVQ
jgi:hypothetical protein